MSETTLNDERSTAGIDAVVVGVGTGGTVTGVSKHIEEDRDASLGSVAVEPAGSPLLSKGEGGSHGIQGIGPSFVPDILNVDVIDEVRTIHEDRTRRSPAGWPTRRACWSVSPAARPWPSTWHGTTPTR